MVLTEEKNMDDARGEFRRATVVRDRRDDLCNLATTHPVRRASLTPSSLPAQPGISRSNLAPLPKGHSC